jgi:hypothetical protein
MERNKLPLPGPEPAQPAPADSDVEELAMRCAAAFLSIAEQSSVRSAYAKLATQRGRLDRSWYELAREIRTACDGRPMEECLYFTGPGDPPEPLDPDTLHHLATLAAAYWSTRGGGAMHDATQRIVLSGRSLNPYWMSVLAQMAERMMDDMSTKIERYVGPARITVDRNGRPTWKHFGQRCL